MSWRRPLGRVIVFIAYVAGAAVGDVAGTSVVVWIHSGFEQVLIRVAGFWTLPAASPVRETVGGGVGMVLGAYVGVRAGFRLMRSFGVTEEELREGYR